jgi:hypothetical protein
MEPDEISVIVAKGFVEDDFIFEGGECFALSGSKQSDQG